MAKRQTHTLEIQGKHLYPLSLIEQRRLPDLEVSLSYDGWDDHSGKHIFVGRVKIHEPSQRFLEDLPAKLRKMKSEELHIEATNKRSAQKEAIDWGDELIAHFLESGLFSMATLDARGMERGKYEYYPELRVVKAKVFKVAG
jgi:hypothetical protein